jgi:hypothetical protein
MQQILIQHQTHGAMELSSPTQEKVSVNGGESNSQDSTGLTESEFSTEEIAVETDLPKPKST